MDEADITAERADILTQEAIRASRKPEGPAPNGRCLWCDEIVGDTQRWCDVTCRNQWEQHQRIKR